MKLVSSLRQGWKGVLLAIAVGLAAVASRKLAGSPLLDPLVVAMLIGITVRSFWKFGADYVVGFRLAPRVFIPIGVALYGAVNLDFVRLGAVETGSMFAVFVVVLVYAISVLLLSHLVGLNPKVGYLLTAGSAICGASAITITSRSIDADPDDVSLSLLGVCGAALLGLLVFLPSAAYFLDMSESDYAVLSGAVLQFTGFVKVAVAESEAAVRDVALSIKAVRYTALLVLIPMFASLVKGKVWTPWFLWAFLGGGLIFTYVPGVSELLAPAFKGTLTVLWSVSMAAVGLNGNVRSMLSRRGLKALGVSVLSFLLAMAVFLSAGQFLR